MSQTIFVTGGAGYIGSHTCVELLDAGYDVVVYDNFSNSHRAALHRVEEITGKRVSIFEGDIRNKTTLVDALQKSSADAVIHFAGLKAVGESVEKPLMYYDNNVNGTLVLLEAMRETGVNSLVFSSSATVYGDPQFLPITESHPLSATNPYGRSKLMIEEILRDFHKSQPDWNIAILRYFNPVGAHKSGLIGEDPQGIPNNLMPFITQVAVGKREFLSVFGGDYDTHDGTGVRDYIHVVDLACGHLKSLEKLESSNGVCFEVNLGTGQGYSVLDIISAFEKASGIDIPYKIIARRPGDVASCYANPVLAKKLLNWEARSTVYEMCKDSWQWQCKNTKGFAE